MAISREEIITPIYTRYGIVRQPPEVSASCLFKSVYCFSDRTRRSHSRRSTKYYLNTLFDHSNIKIASFILLYFFSILSFTPTSASFESYLKKNFLCQGDGSIRSDMVIRVRFYRDFAVTRWSIGQRIRAVTTRTKRVSIVWWNA